VRLFLAVFPPPATRALALRTIDTLRRPNDGVSWVKEDNLHYTMRFIGEVGEDGARRVQEAADEAAAPVAAFDAALGELGAFPNPRKARVIWIGMAAYVQEHLNRVWDSSAAGGAQSAPPPPPPPSVPA